VSQPISVAPREVQRVLDLVSVTGPAELLPVAIARELGDPVTPNIVHRLLHGRTGITTGHPVEIAKLILDAKEEGEAQRRYAERERNVRHYV
jgi:hypothetical protein